MRIRERLGRLFDGREMDIKQQALDFFLEAYQQGRYIRTPDQLATQLQELGSTEMFDLIARLGRDFVTLIGGQEDNEAMRTYYVNECRALWRTDVVAQWGTWLWTNFGYGEDIQIIPEDDKAKETWKEFWDYDQNAPILGADGLHLQSNQVLSSGEFLWIFYIDKTGTKPPRVRIVPTEEIEEIITEPDDDVTPLYYKRSWTNSDGELDSMYYPDYLAARDPENLSKVELPPEAKLAQEQKSETDVVAIHVAHNRKVFSGPGKLRGWPFYSAGAPWAREHTKFREHRASVAAMIAKHVNKIKADAGSKGIDNIAANLRSSLAGGNIETNPGAAAGSYWVENQALDLQRMSQQTGAGDAKTDGEALMQMAALGAGAYSHYFGSGDAYRLATATSMETPVMRQWSRYQNFWGASWRKMVDVVLWAKEMYPQVSTLFKDHNAQVSTDRMVEMDLDSISDSMSVMLRDGLLPYLQLGLISGETGQKILLATWQSVMQALGVADVMELIPAEEELPEEPEEEPEEEPTETELQAVRTWGSLMKGWDARMEMIEGELQESHERIEVNAVCPLRGCDGQIAYQYPDHPTSLVVCATCERTFNRDLE